MYKYKPTYQSMCLQRKPIENTLNVSAKPPRRRHYQALKTPVRASTKPFPILFFIIGQIRRKTNLIFSVQLFFKNIQEKSETR